MFQTILDPTEVLFPIEKNSKVEAKVKDGKIIYGKAGKDGKFKIFSIFSTNPQDYLKSINTI